MCWLFKPTKCILQLHNITMYGAKKHKICILIVMNTYYVTSLTDTALQNNGVIS